MKKIINFLTATFVFLAVGCGTHDTDIFENFELSEKNNEQKQLICNSSNEESNVEIRVNFNEEQHIEKLKLKMKYVINDLSDEEIEILKQGNISFIEKYTMNSDLRYECISNDQMLEIIIEIEGMESMQQNSELINSILGIADLDILQMDAFELEKYFTSLDSGLGLLCE